jgi:hypothetical protein
LSKWLYELINEQGIWQELPKENICKIRQ